MSAPLRVLLKDKGNIIHSITSQSSVYDCVLKLNQLGIGALLVIDNDKLEGIISERDIIRKILGQRINPEKITVKEIMTKNLVTVPPTMTVQEAMRIVTEKRFRHLPVVEKDALLGMISIGDLTRWVMLEQEGEISALTGYIQGT